MSQSRIAVLVLAHANQGVFARLVAALAHPGIAVFCHVDAKADLDSFIRAAPDGVHFIAERTSIGWGGYSMIEAELALFRAAQAVGPFDSYALISGDTLPLISNDALIAILRGKAHTLRSAKQLPTDFDYCRLARIFLPDTSIGSFRGKRYFERHLDPADFPLIRRAMDVYAHPMRRELQLFKGSQWFSISDSLLTTMLAYLAGTPAYEEIFRFTAMPDETFFPTLLRIVDPGPQRTFPLVGVDWTRDPMPYVHRADSDFDAIFAAQTPFYRKFSDACLTLVDRVLENRRSAEAVAALGSGEINRLSRNAIPLSADGQNGV